MWFAEYLCENRIITQEQFAEVARLQQSRRPPLGLLAISTGMMTVDQVVAVLRDQVGLPDKPFGELAIELGFLADNELVDLLLLQSRSTIDESEILVEIGALTAEEVERYRREARESSVRQAERRKQTESLNLPSRSGSA